MRQFPVNALVRYAACMRLFPGKAARRQTAKDQRGTSMTSQIRITAGEAATAQDLRPQYAALCWRMHGRHPRILLVTSRDTGRWIIPKGWPIDGRSPEDVAMVEAWEEAGVTGRAAAEPLGSFTYTKLRPNGEGIPCAVQVFALRVERLERRYPERSERRRKWFTPEKAARKVAEPGLRALLLGFAGEAAGSAQDTD